MSPSMGSQAMQCRGFEPYGMGMDREREFGAAAERVSRSWRTLISVSCRGRIIGRQFSTLRESRP